MDFKEAFSSKIIVHKVRNRNQLGYHGGQCRPLYPHAQRYDEYRIKYYVRYGTYNHPCHRDTGISLGSYQEIECHGRSLKKHTDKYNCHVVSGIGEDSL